MCMSNCAASHVAQVDGVSYSFLGTPNVPGATFNQAVQKSATVRMAGRLDSD
jgi:hypothetical protein